MSNQPILCSHIQEHRAKTMGKAKNSAAVLIVVTALFAVITVSDGANSTAASVPVSKRNTTAASLQGQQLNDQLLSMLQQLLKNPQVIGNFLQSVLPASNNVLKSSMSGSNNTLTPSSKLEALLGNWLSGVSGAGNGSSSALASEFGKLEAHAFGAVGRYFDEPLVKETVLPLMTRVINILREEVRKIILL